MNVGKRITELREVKGYSVNKLADISGVSQSYLRDIELGNKQPTVEYLEYICYGLGVTLQDFFNENNNEDNKLFSAILKLSKEQQEKLIDFLNTLSK